jgi:hypothetical protein
LQPERTALAWRRTALSAAVTAVLLLRNGIGRAAPLDLAAAAGAVLVAALSWAAGGRPGRGRSRRMLFAVASAACATGLLAASQLLWTVE